MSVADDDAVLDVGGSTYRRNELGEWCIVDGGSLHPAYEEAHCLDEIEHLRTYIEQLLGELRAAPTWGDRPFAELDRLRYLVVTYESFIRLSGCVQHAVDCTTGNGCQCGLSDLPLWGKR